MKSSSPGRPNPPPADGFLPPPGAARPGLQKLGFALVCATIIMDLNLSFVDAGSNLEIVLLTNGPNIFLFGVAIALILASLDHPDVGFRTPLLSQDWMYLGWVMIMAASAVWSVSPSITIRAILPLAVLWLATLFLHQLPVTQAVKAVLAAAAVTATLSLVAIPLFGTDYAYQPISSTGAPELRGILEHQLRLGALMALAIGLVVIAKLNGELGQLTSRTSAVNIACLALLIGVLLLSRARLYVAEAAIALVLTILLSRRGSRKLITSVVLLSVAAVVANDFRSLMADLQRTGFDTSLTGRTDIWARTLNGITDDSRFVGHGFGTFRLAEFDYLFPTHYRATHSHSSYIQALFETGLLGFAALLALVVVQLVVAWRYSVRCNRFSYSLFLVLYTALGSTTGLNYAGGLSALFGIMMLFLAIETRMVATSDAPPASRRSRLYTRSPSVAST